MDTDDLKLLALVARMGGFSAAARDLGTDPSTVSRRVAHAEGRLGFRVFERSTRSMRLTEPGETFLAQTEPLLADLDLARDEARSGRRRPRGHLRMTAPVAFAQACVLPHLGDFLHKFADITVEVIPTDAETDPAGSDIDLSLRLTAPVGGDLAATAVLASGQRVVAAPEYLARNGRPDTPDALRDHDCLRDPRPGPRGAWRFRDGESGQTDITPPGRLMLAGDLALRQAACDGFGPALLPDWLVDEDIANGALVDLFPAYRVSDGGSDGHVHAVHEARGYLPRKVQVMIKHLRRSLKGRAAPEMHAVA